MHYQPLQTLSVSADFTLLNNQNPLSGNQLQVHVASGVAVIVLVAAKAARYSTSRAPIRAAICNPTSGISSRSTLSPQVSRLSRRCPHRHGAAGSGLAAWQAFCSEAGGRADRFFISSGSRPTSYYQPVAKLWVPLGKHVSWFTEWRYYGYGEAFYLYEGFRTHAGDHGSEDNPMSMANRTLFVLLVSALAARAAGFTADSARGERLFHNAGLHPMPQRQWKGRESGVPTWAIWKTAASRPRRSRPPCGITRPACGQPCATGRSWLANSTSRPPRI